jgi:hypothetical protein
MDNNTHEPRKYIQLEDDRPQERRPGLRWQWPRLSSSVWWSLISALVLAVAVVGWTMSRQRRRPVRRGNFLDAASLDFVEDLGYLYFDPTDSRVYVFTSFCKNNNNNNHATDTVTTSCGSYDTDCPNDEGYSFCVCGEAWKVTWAGEYEVLSKQTPLCIESVSLDEGKQGSVILADLANNVVESLTVDFSNVDPASATFAVDVAEAIVNSEDYQKRWEG